MNKDLFTLLNTVKLVDVVVTSALFLIIVGVLISQRKNIKIWLENWRKKRNFEDTIMDAIEELKDSDKYLKNDIDELWNTMEMARDTSNEIREEMYADIKGISTNLENVNNKLDNMEHKNNLSKQADIKEKIEKLYRECHANMVCTDTAFETLKDLIADYERHGGENSFVHSLVQIEMYKWDVIETIPDPDAKKE